MTFTLDGVDYALFDHPYNSTRLNERAVEIPLALEFLAEHHGGRGLEVGNVLSHYRCGVQCRIVDRYEQAAGVDNIDLFDIEGTYDWIVSISTIEHIGAPDSDAPVRALRHLRSCLAPGGHMFVSAPRGVNHHLDEAIRTGALHPVLDAVLLREGDTWVQRTRRTCRPYGMSTPWAEAVWVAWW